MRTDVFITSKNKYLRLTADATKLTLTVVEPDYPELIALANHGQFTPIMVEVPPPRADELVQTASGHPGGLDQCADHARARAALASLGPGQ